MVYFAALVLGRQHHTDAVGATVFTASASGNCSSPPAHCSAMSFTGSRGRFATAIGSSVVIAVLAVALIV